VDEGPGGILGREDGVELDRTAAQEGRLFDQSDAHLLPRQVERRPQASDTAADDERAMHGRDADLVQRLEQLGLGDCRADECTGLLGCGLGAVGMGPTRLFADVGRQEQVGVHPAPHDGPSERGLVELGRAGGDDHPVEPERLDVLDDRLLTLV
jgi:hypothetical protein